MPVLESSILLPRFYAKVAVAESDQDCFEWTGARSGGYGMFWDGARAHHAQRWIYEHTFGSVGDLVVRHKCDNPGCVNLNHLEPGTVGDNMQDAHDRARRDDSGEGNGNSRLTWPIVREIRRRHTEGESQRSLAVAFDVGKSQIANITSGRQWRDKS